MSRLLNVGIDIGGTNVKIGVITPEGKIIKKVNIKTEHDRGYLPMMNGIIDKLDELLKELDLTISDIRGFGIGVPGTVDLGKGVVVYAPNISWKNVPIADYIKERLRRSVCIAQDSRAAVWGEYLLGSGRGYTDIMSITLGTGVGCGMVMNEKIYHGGLNTAGEFGHQIVSPNGRRCNCGRRGCLEAYAGAPAILRQALKNRTLRKRLDNAAKGSITAATVYLLAEAGDPDARQITDKVVRRLGEALVNAVNLLSPQVVSLSGGMSNASDALLLRPLGDFLRDHAYGPVAKRVKLVRSSIGDNAPLIGASLLYKEHTK